MLLDKITQDSLQYPKILGVDSLDSPARSDMAGRPG